MEENIDLNQAKVSFQYSTKNIPLYGKTQFLKALVSKTEIFIKNLRWRTFFFLNPDLKVQDKETFGFPSQKPPPILPELKEFEDEIIDMIQNVKFKVNRSTFQSKLQTDLCKVRKDNHLYIPADKTNNYYRIKPELYNHLISKTIQKE